MDAYEWLEVLAIGFQAVTLVQLPHELWRLRREGRLDGPRLREMAGSVSTLVPLLALTVTLGAWSPTLPAAVRAMLPHPIPPTAGAALACLLLVDFLYYWDHRLGHEVRLLWAAGHSVHHSSRHYDPSTALRVSFLDGPLTVWVYAPAVLLGFPVALVASCLGVVLAYQTWIHTERVGKLPLLDPWLNTPSNHRVHHATQPQYLDRNFGGLLMVWDRLLGTYAAEVEPPRYGLTEPLTSSHPVAVHGIELGRLARQLTATRGLAARLRLLFGSPARS